MPHQAQAAKLQQKAAKAAAKAEAAAEANAMVVALRDEEDDEEAPTGSEPPVKKRRGATELVCGACGGKSSDEETCLTSFIFLESQTLTLQIQELTLRT